MNIQCPKNYEEFEEVCGYSPSSPEATYAELAWNHAILRAIRIVYQCSPTEKTVGALVGMLHDELHAIDTGFYLEPNDS